MPMRLQEVISHKIQQHGADDFISVAMHYLRVFSLGPVPYFHDDELSRPTLQMILILLAISRGTAYRLVADAWELPQRQRNHNAALSLFGTMDTIIQGGCSVLYGLSVCFYNVVWKKIQVHWRKRLSIQNTETTSFRLIRPRVPRLYMVSIIHEDGWSGRFRFTCHSCKSHSHVSHSHVEFFSHIKPRRNGRETACHDHR